MDSSDYIVEYRKNRNLSQQKFADLYNVPVSTLRKWEQKESKPSRYFVDMLKNNEKDNHLITLKNDNKTYMFDSKKKIVYNNSGTGIMVNYDITTINKNNLFIILDQLFEDYTMMIGRFATMCILESKGDIELCRLK